MKKLKRGQQFTNGDGVTYELLEPISNGKWKVQIKSRVFTGILYLPTQHLIGRFNQAHGQPH